MGRQQMNLSGSLAKLNGLEKTTVDRSMPFQMSCGWLKFSHLKNINLAGKNLSEGKNSHLFCRC